MEKDGGLEITCLKMKLGEPDESGRRRPEPIVGSEFTIEADSCVMAIGMDIEDDMAGQAGIETNKWGEYVADPDTLATNVRGIFAVGDCQTGPDDAIAAIANGKKAAYFINGYLEGRI